MPHTLQGAQLTLTPNGGCIYTPFCYWYIIVESIETPPSLFLPLADHCNHHSTLADHFPHLSSPATEITATTSKSCHSNAPSPELTAAPNPFTSKLLFMLILNGTATPEQRSSVESDTDGKAWKESVLLMLELFFLLLSSSHHHPPPPRNTKQSCDWKCRAVTTSNERPNMGGRPSNRGSYVRVGGTNENQGQCSGG